MYRENLKDHNVLIHYENLDTIQRYIIDSQETNILTDLDKKRKYKSFILCT